MTKRIHTNVSFARPSDTEPRLPQVSVNLLVPLEGVFANPPHVLVYRPDGKFSVDLPPIGEQGEAVVAFRSVKYAKRLLWHIPKGLKLYRPVRLGEAEWVAAVRRYKWLSIFEPEAGGTVRKVKLSVRAALEYLRATAAA
jgi:hypothetical protein